MLNYVMTLSIVSYLYPMERPFHMTFSFGEVVSDDIKGFKPSLPLGETYCQCLSSYQGYAMMYW